MKSLLPQSAVVAQLNTLTFAVEKTFSPQRYNRGNDFTRLGLGIIGFEINPVLQGKK